MKPLVILTQVLTLAGLFWKVKCQQGKVILCQYEENFWPVDDLAPDGFCTHLAILVHTQVINNGEMLNPSYGNRLLTRLNRLKRRNPSLLALLGMPMERIETLNHTVLFDTLDMYSFDGVDLYWYLPYWQLTDLRSLKEMKSRLVKTNRTLSVSLIYNTDKVHEVKLVTEVGAAADLFTIAPFNRMYDRPSVVSPLGAPDPNNILNAIDVILRQRKIPREKLLLGLPFFGMQTTSQMNEDGTITYESALVPYKWVCEKLTAHSSWEESWDQKTLTPYMLNKETGQTITFDNVESLKKKVELVELKTLRGIAVYDIHSDDDTGKCGKGKYPLATPLKKYFDLLTKPFTFVTNLKNEVLESNY